MLDYNPATYAGQQRSSWKNSESHFSWNEERAEKSFAMPVRIIMNIVCLRPPERPTIFLLSSTWISAVFSFISFSISLFVGLHCCCLSMPRIADIAKGAHKLQLKLAPLKFSICFSFALASAAREALAARKGIFRNFLSFPAFIAGNLLHKVSPFARLSQIDKSSAEESLDESDMTICRIGTRILFMQRARCRTLSDLDF